MFSAKTGVLSRTLIGHELGVWAVNLVSRGGYWGDDAMGSRHKMKQRRRRKEERWSGQDKDDAVVGGLSSRLAEMSMPSGPPGVDHLVPPSLRTALGLEEKPGQDSSYEADVGDDDFSEAEMDPGKRSDDCSATEGWGQPNALVVSGGCDKVLRVWDVRTGYAISCNTFICFVDMGCFQVLHIRSSRAHLHHPVYQSVAQSSYRRDGLP